MDSVVLCQLVTGRERLIAVLARVTSTDRRSSWAHTRHQYCLTAKPHSLDMIANCNWIALLSLIVIHYIMSAMYVYVWCKDARKAQYLESNTRLTLVDTDMTERDLTALHSYLMSFWTTIDIELTDSKAAKMSEDMVIKWQTLRVMKVLDRAQTQTEWGRGRHR